MGRVIWFMIVVVVFAACWGTILLGIGSLSLTYSQLSVDRSLTQLGPEYELTSSPSAAQTIFLARPGPA